MSTPEDQHPPSNRRLWLLVALMAALALFHWRDTFFGSGPSAPAPGAATRSAGKGSPKSPQALQPALPLSPGENPLARLQRDQLKETLARPLFEADRRPVLPPKAPPPPPPPPPRATPPPTFDPTAYILVGIIAGPTPIAVLRQASTNASLRLMEGEEVAGWILDQIRAREIVLVNGNQRVTLELYKPGRAGQPSPPVGPRVVLPPGPSMPPPAEVEEDPPDPPEPPDMQEQPDPPDEEEPAPPPGRQKL